MKILFLLGATSRIRNFDRALEILSRRGHTICLAGRPRKGVFRLPKALTAQGISGRENPTQRADEWGRYVDTLRGARDYVRYLDPRYAQATRLVRRAYEIAPTEFVLYCERHPWTKRHWRLVSAALALCEDLIPVDQGFESFIRDEAPDLILVTPLVTFESYQTDYVKAAHRLGIPVAFLPFSWDNLTNKGLMRIHPDRTLVWNDVQRREAIELHGAPAGTVIVTGAARFDDFFERTASTSRAEFFTAFGLDAARPLLLYLGSSQLTGPNEMELVRRWAESLRASEDPVLRTCGILVRPHPALKDSWTSVDLSDLGNVAVSLHASRNADQELFDSLHHAHAAVGLNTSAMLEAAIARRPVFTLVIPGFDEGQTGTMHFHYLVEAYGGVATVARTFDEHHRQVASVLAGAPLMSERSARFAHRFLRPHGVDRPVSSLVASEIERAGALRVPARRDALWHRPLRWALRAWLARRGTAIRAVEDRTIVGTSLSLRPVKTALQELHDASEPIFVGPWIDSATHELLYWIPFLRWAATTYGLPPERLIVVSRGGARSWYGELAARYMDADTLFSPDERDHWIRRTIPQSEQDPKQAVMYPFDQEIVERAARRFDISDYQVLHPLAFYRVLRRLQSDRAVAQLPQVLTYERLRAVPEAGLTLPPAYVAVSRAFTAAFPDTASNAPVMEQMIGRLTACGPIVVVDDAADSATRTATIAGARAFVGALGELTILAAFSGVPAFAIHSEPVGDNLVGLLRAAAGEGWTMPSINSVDAAEGVRAFVTALG